MGSTVLQVSQPQQCGSVVQRWEGGRLQRLWWDAAGIRCHILQQLSHLDGLCNVGASNAYNPKRRCTALQLSLAFCQAPSKPLLLPSAGILSHLQCAPCPPAFPPLLSLCCRSSAARLGVPKRTAELAAQLDARVAAWGGDRPIHSVLVANNGLAATKFIRSIRSWAYKNFGNDRAGEALPAGLTELRLVH